MCNYSTILPLSQFQGGEDDDDGMDSGMERGWGGKTQHILCHFFHTHTHERRSAMLLVHLAHMTGMQQEKVRWVRERGRKEEEAHKRSESNLLPSSFPYGLLLLPPPLALPPSRIQNNARCKTSHAGGGGRGGGYGQRSMHEEGSAPLFLYVVVVGAVYIVVCTQQH